MSDHRPLLDPLTASARFEVVVRHCPKCGWSGKLADATLRYCGPGQRVDGDWGETFLFGDPDTPACDGPGEHFHWQCAVCRYRRELAVPSRSGPGAS